MEIAVPLIALGGMYIISNQKNEDCTKKEIRKLNQENFVNMGIRSNLATNQSNLNTRILEKDYFTPKRDCIVHENKNYLPSSYNLIRGNYIGGQSGG